MGLFSRKKSDKLIAPAASEDAPQNKPVDHWKRTALRAEEALPLLQGCIKHIKLRGLDEPLLFLPFRPGSTSSSVQNFICNYFDGSMRGDIERQFAITDPLVLVGILRWVYSRIEGGVLTLAEYDLYAKAEREMDYAPAAFSKITGALFESRYKRNIFYGFLDLLASVSAHGQMNGHSAEKLARTTSLLIFHNSCAGHTDFKTGYANWTKAADASIHLFYAHLRDLLHVNSKSPVSKIPLALEKLVKGLQYPPGKSTYSSIAALKLRITVGSFSRSPMALMQRVLHHRLRIDNEALNSLVEAGDNLNMTPECYRVLNAVEAVNGEHTEQLADGGLEADWLDFQDFGFDNKSKVTRSAPRAISAADSAPASPRIPTPKKIRPETQDWHQFADIGFYFGHQSREAAASILPMDLHLPRVSDSTREAGAESKSSDGVLSEVQMTQVDEALWGAWITSLSRESAPYLKKAFGKCVILQTKKDSQWIILEEIVRAADGTAPASLGVRTNTHESFFGSLRRQKPKAKARSPHPLVISGPTIESPSESDHQTAQRVSALVKAQTEANAATAVKSRSTPPRALTHKSASSFYALNIGSEVNTAVKWTTEYDRKPEPSKSGEPLGNSPINVPARKAVLAPPVPERSARVLSTVLSESSSLSQTSVGLPDKLVVDPAANIAPDNKDPQQIYKLKQSALRRTFDSLVHEKSKDKPRKAPFFKRFISGASPPHSRRPALVAKFPARDLQNVAKLGKALQGRPVQVVSKSPAVVHEATIPSVSTVSVANPSVVETGQKAKDEPVPSAKSPNDLKSDPNTPDPADKESSRFSDAYTRPWVQMHSNGPRKSYMSEQDVSRPQSASDSSIASSNVSTGILLNSRSLAPPPRTDPDDPGKVTVCQAEPEDRKLGRPISIASNSSASLYSAVPDRLSRFSVMPATSTATATLSADRQSDPVTHQHRTVKQLKQKFESTGTGVQVDRRASSDDGGLSPMIQTQSLSASDSPKLSAEFTAASVPQDLRERWSKIRSTVQQKLNDPSNTDITNKSYEQDQLHASEECWGDGGWSVVDHEDVEGHASRHGRTDVRESVSRITQRLLEMQSE